MLLGVLQTQIDSMQLVCWRKQPKTEMNVQEEATESGFG